MTREENTHRAVDMALESTPQVARHLEVCSGVRELAQHLENRQTAVALVDADPQPLATLTALEPLVRKYPHTRFVVISRNPNGELLEEAMQIGARRCVHKDNLVTELPPVLRRLVQDVSTGSGESGSIVTVLSASGGCGCTTVAINLADELQLATGKKALLIDMDRFYGAMATYLGVQGGYGIVDVLAQRGTIDAQLVTSTALQTQNGLHVLLSPATVNFADPMPMPYDQLDSALFACREGFGYTIIDAPRMPMDVAASLANQSVLTLIVFELGVIDIRCARAMLGAMMDLRVPRERIHFVVNRFRKRGSLVSYEDARAALEGMPIHRLGNDFEGASRAINLGQTLSQAAPRSDLRKDLKELAALVTAQAPSPVH